MPDSNIFARITSGYYQLTAAEKKVADYIVVQQHQQKVQYFSISELAEACGVSERTIYRVISKMADCDEITLQSGRIYLTQEQIEHLSKKKTATQT